MKNTCVRYLAGLLAASVISMSNPNPASAQALLPGPHEILPFQDAFIIEAFFDLQTTTSGQIGDWTGFSGTSWISPHAYNDHIGSDFSVQTGTPLYATAAGTVVEAVGHFAINDHSTYYGNFVRIALNDLSPLGQLIDVRYAHMLQVAVTNGQQVNVGDYVGLSDNTGNSTTEHVHFQSEIRNGATLCPFFWAHMKYPIMFNPAGSIQVGRVVKVTSTTASIRSGRFDSASQISTAHQNQLYFASYPKRGYYYVFIPNNTSWRSGWIRATDVEEVFTGTVIQPIADNVAYTHLGQLQTKYAIRSQPLDTASQIGQVVFGGGRFVADQSTNGYYRVPVPGTTATWGWVKPNNRMIVYPDLTNPNLNLNTLPNYEFPFSESFSTVGVSSFGRPKFNRSEVKTFSPSSPGGDGKALFITDANNHGNGVCESVLVGTQRHTNYFVQSDVYFNYRPAYLKKKTDFERYGVILRDDGFAGLNTTFEGAGNSYAILWDNDDGRLRAAKIVDGVVTDFQPTINYVTGSGWHTFRIEARGTQIKFFMDGVLLIQVTDSTFHAGQCGIGYKQTFANPPAARGAYFDNFSADVLLP
ncbi:MAG: M23 family metallopeptidase [Verrucomicrobia bacterium]|nr:M23 family metallopeptidase [Verrucomicrobiota bacterium]